mmetsp:Transcript_11323/g.26351  ORF Transcript_11323/g.26351 Transcript_11323/m.26351 type:complete len:419 (-) Transcript_11323:234-1490(-)
MDVSRVLVTKQLPPVEDSFRTVMFQFLRPFSTDLWVTMLCAVVVSAAAYHVLEGRDNEDDLGDGGKVNKVGRALHHSFAAFTGAGGFTPQTVWGRFLTLSWTFLVLLVVSAYTANLAAFLTITSQSKELVDSMEAAEQQSIPLFTFLSYDLWLKDKYPRLPHLEVHDFEEFASLNTGERYHKVVQMLERREIVGYTTDKWTFRRQQVNATLNGDCRLKWVGREVMEWIGAFASEHDSNELCTSTLNYILSLIIEDMVLDGFVDKVLTKAISQQATVSCSTVVAEEEAENLSLATVNMGGAFLLHGIICLVCVAGAVITQHIKRRRKKAKKKKKQQRLKEVDQSSDSSDNEQEDRRVQYIVDKALQKQKAELQQMMNNTVRALLGSQTPPSIQWAQRTGPVPSLPVVPSENAIDARVIC